VRSLSRIDWGGPLGIRKGTDQRGRDESIGHVRGLRGAGRTERVRKLEVQGQSRGCVMASREDSHFDVDLWEAINAYTAACGGDTSRATISGRRMDAVVAVERALEAEGHAKDLLILAMREALNAMKLRIFLIGWPNEPRRGDGSVDWEQEIYLIDLALKLSREGGSS
jgi:hypothetical protein